MGPIHWVQSFRKRLGTHGLQRGSVLTWSSLGCGGTTCFTTVFYMDCRGISALACEAPPLPSFSLTLCAGLVLLHFSNFFHSCFRAVFYPFFNNVITEVPPANGAQLWPTVFWRQLELTLSNMAGSSFSLLTEASPAVPRHPHQTFPRKSNTTLCHCIKKTRHMPYRSPLYLCIHLYSVRL